MTKILENVVDWGTSTKISLDEKIDCACKTGTSQDDKDRWFMGFTPYYVGGVWYGYDTPKSMTSELWYSPANRIWDLVMSLVHEDVIKDIESGAAEQKYFEQPANVVKATFCKYSGKLMGEACYLDPRYDASIEGGGISEVGYFVAGTEPTETCDCHVIVYYDSVTGGIAHCGCPEENLVKVGLIRLEEDRVFPMQLAVSDAEYVYRPMAANMRPATYTYNPYFAATFEKDTFAGVTNYWGAKQFNAFCTVHFDYDAFDKGELKGYLGVYSLAEAPAFHPHAILPSVTPKPEDEDSDEFED